MVVARILGSLLGHMLSKLGLVLFPGYQSTSLLWLCWPLKLSMWLHARLARRLCGCANWCKSLVSRHKDHLLYIWTTNQQFKWWSIQSIMAKWSTWIFDGIGCEIWWIRDSFHQNSSQLVICLLIYSQKHCLMSKWAISTHCWTLGRCRKKCTIRREC